MAMPSLFLLLLLLLLSLLLPLSLSRSTPTQHTPALPHVQASALVQTTCNATTYYDICLATLVADPSSSTADVRGLSSIAVSAAAANASAGASVASSLANATTTASDPTLRSLLRMCAAKYANARDALREARDSIAEKAYDYAFVHVSAAAEYPAACRTLFRRQRPGAYPTELARRQEGLEHLCTVALDIISLLGST